MLAWFSKGTTMALEWHTKEGLPVAPRIIQPHIIVTVWPHFVFTTA